MKKCVFTVLVAALFLTSAPKAQAAADPIFTSLVSLGLGAGAAGTCQMLMTNYKTWTRSVRENEAKKKAELEAASFKVALPSNSELLVSLIKNQTLVAPSDDVTFRFDLQANLNLIDRDTPPVGEEAKRLGQTFADGRMAFAYASYLLDIEAFAPAQFLAAIKNPGQTGRLVRQAWPITVQLRDVLRGEFSKSAQLALYVDHPSLVASGPLANNSLQEQDQIFVGYEETYPFMYFETTSLVSQESKVEAKARALAQLNERAGWNQFSIEEKNIREVEISSFAHGRHDAVVLQIKGARSNEEYVLANLVLLRTLGNVIRSGKDKAYITPEEVYRRQKVDEGRRNHFGAGQGY